jgi:asparagine synthase (glutamine-hydrolysing)
MCGILGLLEPKGLTVAPSAFDLARDTQLHRGPDDARTYRDDYCALGFRRLAILDLSEQGAQPMRASGGAVVIAFNGEIYNFRELRSELERAGHVFRSHSDTEVLLALYLRHGRAFLPILNGMFAFAIYDRERGELLLARDRFGEKPLFIARRPGRIAFASEARALRALPGFSAELSKQAVGAYLRLGFVGGHQCVWRDVAKLPAGYSVVYRCGEDRMEEPQAYWTLPSPFQPRRRGDLLDELGALLDESVAWRLRADVPLGCFLSSGIDSSLVAEAAARQSTRPVSALTVRFPGWEDDEEPVARETARRLGLDHHVVSLKEMRLDQLPALAGHFDEPFADASMLPTALVCRLARSKFTVALSGDGGDEAFAGYDNHVRSIRLAWTDRVPRALRRFAGSTIRAMSPDDSRPARFGWRLAQAGGRWGLGAKLYPAEQWIGDAVTAEFAVSAHDLCAGFGAALGAGREEMVDEAQRTDLRVYLPDDVLVKSDRMSMLASLEVRAPFLDHRLVEFGLSLPSELRASPECGKLLLRQLARKRGLPDAVSGGRKRGFGLPLHAWIFRGPEARALRAVLMDDSGLSGLIFRPGALEQLWSKAESNEALTAAVFRVLCLKWWLAANVR